MAAEPDSVAEVEDRMALSEMVGALPANLP
jgi:hypothetical protein